MFDFTEKDRRDCDTEMKDAVKTGWTKWRKVD